MKKVFTCLLMLSLIMVSACTSNTKYGSCIGIADDEQPNLIYKTSGWNIAMAVIFVETIFVPIVVVADEVKCPVAVKYKLED